MYKAKPNSTLHSNIIANEFEFSPSNVNYKIENHLRLGQKEAYLNQAEITAIHQERLRLEEEARKKQLIEERDKKIKENLKKVNLNKRQIELENELKKKEDKLAQKEKLEKFNKELRNKVIKSNNNIDNSNLKDYSQLNNNENENYEDESNTNNNAINIYCKNSKINLNNNNQTHNNNDNSRNLNIIEELGAKDKHSHQKQMSYYKYSERSKNNAFGQKSMQSALNRNKRSNLVSKDFETFSFNENEIEIENEMEKPPQPTQKGNLRLINRELKENESVIDIRDDIDLLIKRKLDLAKNNYLVGELGNMYAININNNLDTEENSLNNFNNHQRLNSNFLINSNNLKNQNSKYILNNANNVNNINTTLTNTSICDISSISNRKIPNSSSNLNHNLIRNIMTNPDNKKASSNYKQNNNNKNHKNNNSKNQNPFYNISTNILSCNRINDSALSEFSNDNPDNKLRKTKSSNALSKKDFSNSKGTVSMKNMVNNKSKAKSNMNLNLNSHNNLNAKSKDGKNTELSAGSSNNRISSANIKNSNSFFKITSTKKSVENNVKNSLTNSMYFRPNTQNTENDSADNADNYGSYAVNKNKNNAAAFNIKINETAYDSIQQLNNTNQNTSCLSDVNIKSILERNIETVKNFRKTGLTRLAEPNNILSNDHEVSSFVNASGKNMNMNNISVVSNNNTNNNQILSVRKFENLSNNVNNPYNRNNISSQLSNKLVNESSISKTRESKSHAKINVNLQKRRITKALKNLMVEKFKEKNIIIPNICSCGQLQKKIDTLLENKHMNVYSIMNIECANNCIYYNNNTDYQKALTDIIKSVKNFKLENL